MYKSCLALISSVMLGLWLYLISFNTPAYGEEQMDNISRPIKIKLLFNNQEAVVSLLDNSASRDFIALLPLTMTFEDYNRTEKISTLPRKLNISGSPSACDPDAGSFTYYAPWGNLAIFYRDFRHSPGLAPLGKVESGLDNLAAQHNKFTVHLEIID